MSELATDRYGQTVYQLDGEVLEKFMLSAAPVQIICGPVGSGKSKTCGLKLWAIANAQQPGPDGIRRTRFAVCRSTYPQLRTTTVRTWLDTFPEQIYGAFKWTQPPTQTVTWGDVSMAVDFLALDDSSDIQKLRSGESPASFSMSSNILSRRSSTKPRAAPAGIRRSRMVARPGTASLPT
jgi:hypothetical protein